MRVEPEFFVGYLPLPAGLRRMMSRVIAGLTALIAIVAAVLIAGQHPFAASTFEYHAYRDFRGVLIERPYPMLAIAGEGLPWLLAGPGKHGVVETLRGLDGRQVELKGSRILRDGDHMIEIVPGSVKAGSAVAAEPEIDLGGVELNGEIVDSKCYLGVMNPGEGKVHRDCAARCIAGGIPPAFLVRDAGGQSMAVLLDGAGDWLGRVGEPITLRGRLVRIAGRLVLKTETKWKP